MADVTGSGQQIHGTRAHDAPDGDNPVKIGGIGRNVNPSAAANNDRVDSFFDLVGRQIISPYVPRDLVLHNTIILSSTAETTLLAAAVSTFHDLIWITASNTSSTAVRLDMNLVVLVLRDDAYGMIKWKQDNMGFTPFGLDYGNPDFVRYAESYGANGHRVTSSDRLLPLMKQCHESPGVHLIEVPVDYADNDRILNREIRERSQQI